MTGCIGLGSDLLRIERITRMGMRSGPMLLDRLLAPAERVALAGYGDAAADWPGCAGQIATLFAGKEAFFKALGTGLVQPLRWSDVAVIKPDHAASGRSNGLQADRPDGSRQPPDFPAISLQGAAATAFAALGGVACHLALSATPLFVLATVILLGRAARPMQSPRLSSGDEHA